MRYYRVQECVSRKSWKFLVNNAVYRTSPGSVATLRFHQEILPAFVFQYAAHRLLISSLFPLMNIHLLPAVSRNIHLPGILYDHRLSVAPQVAHRRPNSTMARAEAETCLFQAGVLSE